MASLHTFLRLDNFEQRLCNVITVLTILVIAGKPLSYVDVTVSDSLTPIFHLYSTS